MLLKDWSGYSERKIASDEMHQSDFFSTSQNKEMRSLSNEYICVIKKESEWLCDRNHIGFLSMFLKNNDVVGMNDWAGICSLFVPFVCCCKILFTFGIAFDVFA